MMNPKDFFDWFKLNILKNARRYFFLVCWFVLFAYIPLLLNLLPTQFMKYLPNEDDWIVPLGVIRFVLWVVSFLLLEELLNQLKSFGKKGTSYKFTVESWRKDWIYNGKPKLLTNPVGIRVNSSRAGCLYTKQLWKDFEMKFNVNFFTNAIYPGTTEVVSVIFRAQDLENYLMLEIQKDGSNKLLLKPHVRYQGMWEVMKEEIILTGESSNEFTVKLIVKDLMVKLETSNGGTFEWELPTHVDINLIETGIKEKKTDGNDDNSFANITGTLPQIDFRNSYGMIGFRAHINQGADITKLSIQKLKD